MQAFDWAYLGDKSIDLSVGVAATFVGILLVFVIARPRVEFAAVVFASPNPDGTVRYGVRVRPRSRLLQITELHIEAYIAFGRAGKSTSVPIPLSRSRWAGVRRRKSGGWTSTPQLFLGEVAWGRHLTRSPHPSNPRRLERVLAEKDAKLVLVVTAVSAVFGVTSISRWDYGASQIKFGSGLVPDVPTMLASPQPARLSMIRRGVSSWLKSAAEWLQ